MRILIVRVLCPAILLLLASAAPAETVEKGYHIEPPVLSPQSTDKFLGNVRNYGDGRPSPNVVRPTEQAGGRKITDAPSTTPTGKPTAQPRTDSKPLAGSESTDKRPPGPN